VPGISGTLIRITAESQHEGNAESKRDTLKQLDVEATFATLESADHQAADPASMGELRLGPPATLPSLTDLRPDAQALLTSA